MTLSGDYRVAGSRPDSVGPLVQGGQIEAVATGGMVRLTANGKPLGQAARLAIDPVRMGSGAWIRIASGQYRDRLVLTARGSGFDAVNELPLDDWLRGVLPAEIGDSPMEALKAQAVASRSEAVHKLERAPHAAEGYDFCSSTHCQVYKGMGVETPACNAAVEATRGQVLVVEAG